MNSDLFRTALALDPTKLEPLASVLGVLIARGNLPQALATAEAAAQRAPQICEHWQAAANIAAQMGQTTLATA